MTINQHIGARLKQVRKERRLSQSAVGAILGIAWQQVSKYEAGTNRISAASLWTICGALKVHMMYFFDGATGGE